MLKGDERTASAPTRCGSTLGRCARKGSDESAEPSGVRRIASIEQSYGPLTVENTLQEAPCRIAAAEWIPGRGRGEKYVPLDGRVV